MEQSKKASQYYLPMGFWVCLVVFGIASFWRLFVALNKQLSILGYLDFFIVTACLVVGSLLQNKWRRYLIAAGLVALAVFTQIVNKGFGFNLGGIFLSGSALLSLRYASDLLYYVLMLVIAVLILCNKNKTAGILALVAAVFSLIRSCVRVTSGQVASTTVKPFSRARRRTSGETPCAVKMTVPLSIFSRISNRFAPSRVIMPSSSNASTTWLL